MFEGFILASIYIISEVNVTESTTPANMTTNSTTERSTLKPRTPTTTSKQLR